MKHLIGFDIGGTKCAVVLGRQDEGGIEILDRISFPTETEKRPNHALDLLEENTKKIAADNGLALGDISAIGISCGGPIDSRRGLILSPPNLPGWDEIHIVERFKNAFGLPAALQNDANACALAEWKWGAGKGAQNLIFLTFGTGMGAGLILDGRLYIGASELAGEVGHIRLADDGPLGYGKHGSFEGFCSGGGIARYVQDVVRKLRTEGKTVSFCRDETELNGLTTRRVAEAAQSGDAVAVEIFKEVGRRLGQGLSILIDVLNPDVIVIGSIFARQQDLLWPTAEEVIKREALLGASSVCRVLPAKLGEQIGDYAALSVASEGV